MNKIHWHQIEPILAPHATVANGRELHWVGWCWQILDHQGLTTYGSEPEKAMVLMRALALMRIHQDYAFIMLEIEPTLEEAVVFQELSAAVGCTSPATMLWEHKRIMSILVDAYVEWSPLIGTYDPDLADEHGWSEEEVLEDLKKTLPPGDEGAFEYAMYPDGYNQELREDEGVTTLQEYHEWLDSIRAAHIEVWVDNNFVLPPEYREHAAGVRLYFHASWEQVEPFFRDHTCWGTTEELAWYREMWTLLQDGGYTGYKVYIHEVAETLVRLVLTYQTFCYLALDRPVAIDGNGAYNLLVHTDEFRDPEAPKWEPNELVLFLVERFAVLPSNRSTGRFGRNTQDRPEIFMRRATVTLPITSRSLAQHYESEAAWRFDGPAGVDYKAYNAMLFSKRIAGLKAWLETGCQPAMETMQLE